MSLYSKFKSCGVLLCYLFVALICLSFIDDQLSRKEAEIELENLSGSAYYKKGIELGSLFQKDNLFDDALYFYKKVSKKSAELPGIETQAIVGFEIASKISENKANSELQYYAADQLLIAAENIKDNYYLSSMYEIAEKYFKNSDGKVKKKLQTIMALTKKANVFVINEKKRLELEATTVRVDKEELSTIKNSATKLSMIKDELSVKMKESEKLLTDMSKENLIKETLIEKQGRFIDSLAYRTMIDSISIQNKNYEIKQNNTELSLQKTKTRLILAMASLVLLLSGFLFYRFSVTKSHNKNLEKKNEIIAREQQRSEELLLNILPLKVAEELKENGKVMAQHYDNATIMFTDFVNFSNITKKQSPQELVNDLDHCFRRFDTIVNQYGVEKIKTIGDAYMCISGVPDVMEKHAESMILVGFEFLKFLKEWNKDRLKFNKIPFEIRIGIHSGAVSAGVVGKSKFVFDVWGDAVNVASRMESNSEEGKINISESTYQLIKSGYACTERGAIKMKNMKEMNMYFVNHLI